MTVSVICPDCKSRFDAADEGIEVECPRCQAVFTSEKRDPYSEGIQTASSAAGAPAKKDIDFDDEDDIALPMRPPRPRTPFPVTPLLVLIVGLVLLLLIFSCAFNIWFLTRPRDRVFGYHESRVFRA